MNFAERETLILLWLLPLAAFLLWAAYRRRQRRLAAFASLRLPELLTHSPSTWRTVAKALLWLTALGLVILSLARPRWGFEWRDVPRGGIDLIVALDLSTSMLATDIKPSRLERAKRELIDLLQMLEGDRLGIVAFAGVAFVQVPLTVDYRLASLFISQLNTDLMPVQGTALGEAIRLSTSALEKASAAGSQGKAIILITDGEDQSGEAMAAARAAKEKGIKIYGIGIGSREGAPIPLPEGGFKKTADGQVVISRLAEESLEELVVASGGVYVRSTTGDLDLEHIYRQGIRAKISDQEYGVARQRIWYERFQWFLLLAFLLLTGEALLNDFAKRRRSKTKTKTKAEGGSLALWFVCSLPLAAGMAEGPRLWAADVKAAQEAFEAKDYEKATKGFLEAEIEEPHNLKHAYNRALSQYKAGDFAGAASGFAKAAQANDKKLAAQSQFNLGNALVAKGDLAGAKAAFEQAQKINPQDQEAAENRAWVERALAAQPPPPPQQGQGEQDKDNKQQQGGESAQNQSSQSQSSENKPSQNQSPQDQQAQNQQAGQGQDAPQQGQDKDKDAGKQQQDQASQKPEDGGQGQQQDKASAQGGSKPDEQQASTQQPSADKDQQGGQAPSSQAEQTQSKDQQQAAGGGQAQDEQAAKAGEQKNEQQAAESGEQGEEQQAAAAKAGEQGQDGNSATAGAQAADDSQATHERKPASGMMQREAAERLLRSLESQDELYGKPRRVSKPAHPSKKDW